MRVVVQRVSQSNVNVSGEVIGKIKEGLMVIVSFVDESNLQPGTCSPSRKVVSNISTNSILLI